MVEPIEGAQQIVSVWNKIPEEHRNDFTLCLSIIRETMGLKWLEKHFDPGLERASIFKIGGGTSEEEAARNYRVIDLAECMINLKDVEGISECLSRMREAQNPEARYAELHIGKMLYINQWPFRFVKPQELIRVRNITHSVPRAEPLSRPHCKRRQKANHQTGLRARLRVANSACHSY
jgi:hypothetical protein